MNYSGLLQKEQFIRLSTVKVWEIRSLMLEMSFDCLSYYQRPHLMQTCWPMEQKLLTEAAFRVNSRQHSHCPTSKHFNGSILLVHLHRCKSAECSSIGDFYTWCHLLSTFFAVPNLLAIIDTCTLAAHHFTHFSKYST